MKFLRSKAAVIFIAFISILCIIAAVIAIDISIVMIKKKDQAVRPITTENHNEDTQVSAKPVKASKLEEHVLYFNGQILEGMTSFSGSEESCFIPMDTLLKTLGVAFKYYASDDILEFVLNGRKVTVKINHDEVMIDGKKVKLKLAAQAAKNHILVSEELLEYIEGFGVSRYIDKKHVFINYFPEAKKYTDRMKILKITNGIAGISDISGDKLVWKSRKESFGNDRILASGNQSGYIIKALDKVFLIRSGQGMKPRVISAGTTATWSVDGKFLYWVDKNLGTSYSYNIDTGMKKELGNYYQRVSKDRRDSTDKNPYEALGILLDFKESKRYKRITLTDVEHSNNHTFIERNGKTTIEGPVSFSPDHNRLFYHVNGEGYYTAGVDGRNKKFIGKGTAANWINNKRIMIYDNNRMYVVSADGEEVIDVATPWRMLGETIKGDVLYTDGNTMYSETGGKEIKRQSLVVSCDRVFSADADGPYIAVSTAYDKIYLINKGTVDEIGNSSGLLKGKDIGSGKLWIDSILHSPNGVLTSMAKKVDGFIKIDVLDNKTGDLKSLTLNHQLDENEGADSIKMNWLDDKSLVVHTTQRGWVIEFDGEIGVYGWKVANNEKIEGILLK